MARMSAAQALIQSLRAQGVDTIFGIISSHTMEIFDALYDHQDAIRFISARHEQAAAMMADGYARVTGKPGICLTSTGPGAANSMGGIGEAYCIFSSSDHHEHGRRAVVRARSGHNARDQGPAGHALDVDPGQCPYRSTAGDTGADQGGV